MTRPIGSSLLPRRSELRIKDLKSRAPAATRLMNIKVPAHVAEAIDQTASQLNVSKTEVVIALLNEGLAMAGDTLKRR